MDFEQAAEIVRALLCQNVDRNTEFTGTPAAVVSTISTIIQLSSHVQELSGSCPQLRSIVLGVYGSVVRETDNNRNKLVTLFGPRVEGFAVSRLRERTEPSENTNRNSIRKSDTANGNNSAGVETVGTNVDGLNSSCELVRTRNPIGGTTRQSNGVALPLTPLISQLTARQARNDTDVYQIPEIIAVQCMSYLLDMSGCTSHPRGTRLKDIDNVNARLVQGVVKVIFKKHKEFISRRGVRVHGIQYQSLVPADRRGIDVIFPNMRLSRSKNGNGYRREGELRTNFSIGKADRNKKEQNIALISSLIHHKGHGVNVEEILADFGRKGLGTEGCKRFGGCRHIPSEMRCRDAPRDDCSLYTEVEGKRKLVGKGSVDPFLSYVLGKDIPRNAIVVRVSTELCAIELEKLRKNGVGVHENWYVWPKVNVGRVEFLGEYKEVLGSSIFMCKLYPEQRGEGANEITNGSSVNICDAVLLCDVTLAEGKDEETYPFEEWYGIARIRKIRELQENTPKLLGDVLKNSERVMLWNSGRLTEMGC